MERKIGEKFEYSPGVWLEVAPEIRQCEGCFFAPCPCRRSPGITGHCSKAMRSGRGGAIFRRCDPPAPEKPETPKEPKPSEAVLEFSAVLHEIKTAPPPTEWMQGMTEAWQNEIIEAARDAFVYRFWDMPNTTLALVMGVSEATVRRIRKKRLRKNREQD